jgi:hypothetical protein
MFLQFLQDFVSGFASSPPWAQGIAIFSMAFPFVALVVCSVYFRKTNRMIDSHLRDVGRRDRVPLNLFKRRFNKNRSN